MWNSRSRHARKKMTLSCAKKNSDGVLPRRWVVTLRYVYVNTLKVSDLEVSGNPKSAPGEREALGRGEVPSPQVNFQEKDNRIFMR